MSDGTQSPTDDKGSEGGRGGRRFPLGVAIASVVAGLILVALLLPRVLLYPAEPEPPPAPDYDSQLALLRAHNEAMEEEVQRLEGLLGSGVCRLEDGTLSPPGGNNPDPASPDPSQPDPTQPDPGGSRTSLPVEIPAPNLAQAQPPAGGEPIPLVQLLDDGVAFVLALHEDGFVTGSAFAVTPTTVLTNLHVVEGASEIWIASHALPEVQPVKLSARLGGGALGDQDYALLTLPDGAKLQPLAFAPTAEPVERLTQVVAAGYPGLLLSTDEQYKDLIDGDRKAMPSLVLTQGIVTVVQDGGAVPLVVHSAQLSPGSSGGPLVDLCGRVLGLNTFVTSDATAAHMNYALSGGDLVKFLGQAGVTPPSQAGQCTPQQVASGTATTQ